jgi:hypothetical protein
MEIKRILSGHLPALSASVLECVNNGRWTLFRTPLRAAPSTHPDVAYYIKGGGSLYRLDAAGEVLSIGKASEAPPMEEIIYFSDIPSPPSLSERRPGRCSCR